jgi:pilus assembly protein CpaF
MASAVLTNASIGATRYVGSPLDLPRRAHALLAERFPAHRTKHKPLSILRQEGRRALEQFFDAQVPPPAKADRDRQVEEILGEANGFGPLEELFRDEAVREVMVLAAAQVIVRKDGGWVPTSVRFRDPAHQRTYLRRLADTGEPFVTGGGGGDGAFDVRLANGFRVIGVLPPDVLDTPPVAVFVRGLPHTADQPAPTFPTATMSGWVPGSALIRTPAPIGGGSTAAMPGLPAQGSGVTTMPLHRLPLPPKPGSVGVTAAEITRIAPASGTFNKPDSLPPRPTPLPVPDAPVSEFYLPPGMDPKERMRRRVSERIIRKCAAAGVYDLSAIPAAELQRVILAHVEELNGEDTRRLNDQEMQMVALEIFTGMRR